MQQYLHDGRQLILASTSPYRRELLRRLTLEFLCEAPDVDEGRHAGETAEAAVRRLAQAKARAVAARHRQALVVGSDQLAEIDGEVLGKPGSESAAVSQLRRIAGRTVTFHTGLCVRDSGSGREQLDCVPYQVTLRPLSITAIRRYVAQERPLDCAGSFKSEGLGVSLFECQRGTDPTALLGLPMIRLVAMLALEGIELP
jgi:MAF protein